MGRINLLAQEVRRGDWSREIGPRSWLALLVSGGVDSGKTWMALEHAHQLAAADRNVLFLCYNLQLAFLIKQIVAKLYHARRVCMRDDLGGIGKGLFGKRRDFLGPAAILFLFGGVAALQI